MTRLGSRPVCANCGLFSQGNFSVHTGGIGDDGFGTGPEAPLCDSCGGEETPSLEDVLTNIARRQEREIKGRVTK